MPFEPAQIEFHLALVPRFKLPELEVNSNQTPELAVIEQQVEIIIPVVNLHTLLAGDETKTHAHFEDESLHLSQDRRFQVLLRISVFQAEKIEYVGIAKDHIGR